jgi:hypothetical protein
LPVVVVPNFPEETAEPLGQVFLQVVKREPLDKVGKAVLGVRPQVVVVVVATMAVAVAVTTVVAPVRMAVAAAAAVLRSCPQEVLALPQTTTTTVMLRLLFQAEQPK